MRRDLQIYIYTHWFNKLFVEEEADDDDEGK